MYLLPISSFVTTVVSHHKIQQGWGGGKSGLPQVRKWSGEDRILEGHGILFGRKVSKGKLKQYYNTSDLYH